jgi:hypothetical protein
MPNSKKDGITKERMYSQVQDKLHINLKSLVLGRVESDTEGCNSCNGCSTKAKDATVVHAGSLTLCSAGRGRSRGGRSRSRTGSQCNALGEHNMIRYVC